MFSVVTTSRGRLAHLKQTLPKMIGESFKQIVVVDYDCPEGTIDWVSDNFPAVLVVKVHDALGFSASIARNQGALRATEEWLCFLDADTVLSPGFVGWLASNVHKGAFYINEAAVDKDTTGALVCRKADFDQIGGYDEILRGWGGEDLDIRQRLISVGVTCLTFPRQYLQSIPHGDNLRVPVSGFSIHELEIRANLYVRAKTEVCRMFGGMEPCCRRSLLDRVGELIKSRPVGKLKTYYPLAFLRYCSVCSRRLNANQRLTVERTRSLFSRKKKYALSLDVQKSFRFGRGGSYFQI